MMLAPSWALIGSAIDAPTNPPDPHVVKGVHLHVLPSPLLGLPATPLFVYRLGIHQPAKSAKHTEIRWVDSEGNELTTPFELTEDNPVTGYLAPGAGRCMWIEVQFGESEWTEVRMDARIREARGAGVVASILGRPCALAAPRIDEIALSGSGIIDGVRWIAMEDLQSSRRSFWRAWSLPVNSGPRYKALSTAVADANARVAAGAPPHFPLYVRPVQGGPSKSPVATLADEQARIARLSQTVAPRLSQLINDLSAPPSRLTEPLPDATDANVKGNIYPLGHVIQSAVDPSMARWMGFSDVDNYPLQTHVGDLAVYFVRALWIPDSGQDDKRLALLAPARVPNTFYLQWSFPELSKLGGLPSAGSQFYDLGMFMAAIIGAPQDKPEPPIIDAVEIDGLRRTNEDIRAVLKLKVHGLVQGAEVALVKSGMEPRNPRLGDTRVLYNGEPGFDKALPLPLSATVPTDATAPLGSGEFQDRDGNEGGNKYLMAQADWFGRWSEWATTDHVYPMHDPPFPPLLEPRYVQPQITAGDQSAVAGTFKISVSVPGWYALPPGGYGLKSLTIVMTVDGGPALPAVTFTLSTITNPPPDAVTPDPMPTDTVPGLLTVELPGPALLPAAQAQVSFVGVWTDVGDVDSPQGPEATLVIQDPRALPAPEMPTTLLYAKRPDALGQARVELPLPTTGPAKYRIFYTSETTALAGLQILKDAGSTEAATALNELADPTLGVGAARAAKFGKYKHLLDWSMFENLTKSPFVPPSGQTFFAHTLSGSLEGLAFYRVLSVAPSGALSDFATSPMVAAAVPNQGPPPQPLVSAVREDQGARLTVKVPIGPISPVAFRIRRGVSAYKDIRQMLIVANGELSASPPASSWLKAAPTVGTQGTRFELFDPGPLKSWRTYYWAVEVQANRPAGAPTDGGFVPTGEWSPPSALAGLALQPAQAPAAPTVAAERVDSDVTVTITLPTDVSFDSTPFGSFAFEIFRVESGLRPTRVDTEPTKTDDTTFTFTDVDAPANVFYLVRIVDPLKRRSEATQSSTV